MVLSGRGVIRRVLGIASRATEIDCSTYPSTYPRYVPQRATGKRAACVVCSAVVKKRRPLGYAGSKENVRGPNTVRGCLTCDVALCHTDFCWDLFHNSKLGVV